MPYPQGPQQDRSLIKVLIIIGVVVVVLAIGGAVALGLLIGRAGGMAEIEPTEIPALMKENLPCKAKCRVTNITLYGEGFAVGVVSEDIPGRTLVYRISHFGSELGFSTDWDAAPVEIDVDEIDWTNVDKLRRKLEAHAIQGRTVSTVSVAPCAFDVRGKPVRACMKADILTAKGQETMVLDAKTGEEIE